MPSKTTWHFEHHIAATATLRYIGCADSRDGLGSNGAGEGIAYPEEEVEDGIIVGHIPSCIERHNCINRS